MNFLEFGAVSWYFKLDFVHVIPSSVILTIRFYVN